MGIRHCHRIRRVILLWQISEEHARLVAQQVDVYSVDNCQDTSTGDKGIDAGQQLILQEIQKMSKRFGALEEQAANDREVLD